MTVVELKSSAEADIRNFLNLLYREQEGYVYTPTIGRTAGIQFTQYWWEWPRQREEIVSHVVMRSPSVDCFVGPCLYKTRGRATKDNIKGSYVAYTEMDGDFDPTKSPLKINFALLSSQTKGHAHLYWVADDFCENVHDIEYANKALTFAMGTGADRSVVDATQVLRFPSTYNHKRDQRVGALEINSRDRHRWSQFAALELPDVLRDTLGLDYSLEDLPTPLEVIGKYVCPPDLLDLMGKRIESPNRSAALFKVAMLAVELGMSNREVLSLLYNRAVDWGKFKDRQDIQKQLNSLLGKARLKHPALGSGKDEPRLRVVNFQDFLKEKYEIEWVIPDLITRRGMLLVSGQPGVGKTQLAFQYGLSMAIGEDFCGFSVPHSRRILFVSLEMEEAGFHLISGKIHTGFGLSEEQKELTRANLHMIFPLSSDLSLTKNEGRALLHDTITSLRPDGIIVDSLGQLVSGSLNDDEGMRDALNFLRDLGRAEDLFTILIHHNRKPQVGNSKPRELGDLYGSQYIGGIPDVVQIMFTENPSSPINVRQVKNRYARHRDITVVRGDNLRFELYNGSNGASDKSTGERGVNIGKAHDRDT